MYKEILQAIADATGIPAKRLQEASSLEEVGLDSMDILDLVFALEKRFAITIENEELNSVATIEDLVLVVRNRVQGLSSQ